METVQRKRAKRLFFSLFATVILATIMMAYAVVNRGVAVEIASEVTVGEEVVIPSANGELRGSYFAATEDRSPAVVMVTGSQTSTYRRAWADGGTDFWKPMTELLQENGYAVLLLEKRGVNGSAGHWEHQSFEDRAGDVKDAIEYLKTRGNIDAGRIGIVGHSQGGWIAQLASVLYPDDVAFIVNLAGPSTTVTEQILDDYESQYLMAGLSESEIEKKLGRVKSMLNFVHKVAPVLKFGHISHIIRHDAEHVSRNLKVPVFAVYGENDELVPPEKNIALMKLGLAAAGNTHYRIHTLPGANHNFKRAPFGTPREALEEVETSPDFLAVMREFVEWERDLHDSK